MSTSLQNIEHEGTYVYSGVAALKRAGVAVTALASLKGGGDRKVGESKHGNNGDRGGELHGCLCLWRLGS